MACFAAKVYNLHNLCFKVSGKSHLVLRHANLWFEWLISNFCVMPNRIEYFPKAIQLKNMNFVP